MRSSFHKPPPRRRANDMKQAPNERQPINFYFQSFIFLVVSSHNSFIFTV